MSATLVLRAGFAGAFSTLAVLALTGAILPWLTPTNTAMGPIVRIMDAFAPHLLLLCVVFAGLAFVLGNRWIGLGLLGTALVAAAVGVLAYRDATLPRVPDANPDLRILFLNTEHKTSETSAQIVDAVLEESPDVLVLTEAMEVMPSLARLQEAYPFVSPCTEASCEILLASRKPIRRFWRLQLNPVSPERYAVAEIELDDGRGLFVSATHLVKPWFSRVAEQELEQVTGQYNWFEGPVVAVGDYNMPPWNRPMRELLEATGFRALRNQTGTWPAAAGRAGFPIDQVLVRDGVRVVEWQAFGDDLPSNHLGFLASLVLLPDAPQ